MLPKSVSITSLFDGTTQEFNVVRYSFLPTKGHRLLLGRDPDNRPARFCAAPMARCVVGWLNGDEIITYLW